ncbi:tyrosine kinase catalytic domain protein [Rhizoctonia solani 123E]|uniref:Tyrosine kinase catalytic domain protein n=1 Tax=Rhizoctonia solani 123E TaxID=1423351 RepID=A0A074RWT1_9AGAM|nr:tyrosine kinase catalytic domain protein [Rhizoctonia solani 123E]
MNKSSDDMSGCYHGGAESELPGTSIPINARPAMISEANPESSCGTESSMIDQASATGSLVSAKDRQETLDASGTSMKDHIVADSVRSVPGSSGHTLGSSLIEESRLLPVEDLGPRPTLISCTMSINEVADCLIQHNCKDITSELDFEGCSSDSFSRGGFGEVYKGYLRKGEIIAIKCIEVSGNWGSWKLKEKSLKHAAHELYVWSQCDHPRILKFLGFARFGGHILLVSPWMKNGSLLEYIDHHPKSDRLQLSAELTSALAYLHHKGIVHGDVKASNVVICDDGHVQLGDFGNSSLLEYTSVGFTHTRANGTTRFMAPEILQMKTEKPTAESDIYALGMTIFHITTGEPPFADLQEYAIWFAVTINKSKPDRPVFHEVPVGQITEHRLWNLLNWCWSYEPEDRPTAIRVEEALATLASTNQTDQLNHLFELERPATLTTGDNLKQGSQLVYGLVPPLSPTESTSSTEYHSLSENPTTILSNSPVPPSPQMKILPQISIPKRQLEQLVIDTGSPRPLASPENEIFYDVLGSWPGTPIQPPASGPCAGTNKALLPLEKPNKLHKTLSLIPAPELFSASPSSSATKNVSANNLVSSRGIARAESIRLAASTPTSNPCGINKALLIGLNYELCGKPRRRLRYVADDSRRLAATLTTIGYASENIKVATDEPKQSSEYLVSHQPHIARFLNQPCSSLARMYGLARLGCFRGHTTIHRL